jgi:hypothetical protein
MGTERVVELAANCGKLPLENPLIPWNYMERRFDFYRTAETQPRNVVESAEGPIPLLFQ